MAAETEWAYLAGLLDGEGSIAFCLNGPGITRVLRVSISNTDTKMIAWIKEHFGGNVATWSVRNPAHRTCYRVQWNSSKATPILQGVLPYLQTKKVELTKLALDYLECRDSDTKQAILSVVSVIKEER